MDNSITGVRSVIISEQELRFERFEVPAEPRDTEVLLKVERTIISAGTELANYTGLDPNTRRPNTWCSYPWIPGYGGIGQVIGAGARTGFKTGDRVYAKLNHADHAVVDTDTQFCVRVPDNLDSTTASFVRMGNVAISAYQRATAKMGDSVVVIGLGLVGNLAGQFFRIAGQRVIGIDPAAHRRELALQTGFHAAIASGDSLAEELKAANYGAPPRIVVEAVGDSRLIEQSIKLVATNGQVILLGSPRAPYETNCTPMLTETHLRAISVIGALEWTIPLLKKHSPGNTTESNAELILRLMASGDLNVKPLLSHVLPPAELNDAYQGLLHRKNEYLGVVIDWENHPPPPPNWQRA